MLDGFPLALEIVLANLAHQSPAEVLAALQSGDVSIDPRSDSQDKTESILCSIDYSHSNLSPEAQQLLLCLAPFTSVVYTRALDNYTNLLRKQPVMASLPFERWPEVLQEAENWGLLSTDPAMPRILRLQPIFPYFLLNRLNAPEQREARSAVETAFREHYDQIGEMLFELLQSKEPQKRQSGQILTGLEYKNLITALNLALTAQVSILNLYNAISTYLDITQDQSEGLELGQVVLSRLESYSTIKFTGQVIDKFIGIIDNIAMRQFLLKQYVAAEESYKKAIAIMLANKDSDSETIIKKGATIYHQLGMVAQGQRHWEQAEQYYQQALQIFIEYNVREYQGATYLQLGKAYYEQRKWEQAEQCFQQALNIRVEYNDRHEQAKIYHLFGSMFLAQRHWEQAEQYYQQALEIYIVYKDFYAQADAYHNLGIIAREQRKWNKAEQYYQKALHIYIMYNDLYRQAGTYLQLGMLAEEQRQWKQAEQYYQQTLQVKYNDRHVQAIAYHQLGRVAQGQQQWERAEQYYQQSLQIKNEDNDHYGQAITNGQLGLLEQDRKQWSQARDYHLRALGILITYEDNHYIRITIRNLAQLWKSSGDANLPAAIAPILGASVEETEKLLREMLGEE